MSHYMVELLLTDQPVTVIGGGVVARRKLVPLLELGARVTVIAPTLDGELAALVAAGRITHQATVYTPDWWKERERPVLVFAATGSADLNRTIARECRAAGLWCNSADDPEVSGFLVAAQVRQGAVLIGIGTGGNSPALSRVLKEQLAAWLTPGWGELVTLFGQLRREVTRTIDDPAARGRFWRNAAQAVITERRLGENQEANRAWLRQRLERETESPTTTDHSRRKA